MIAIVLIAIAAGCASALMFASIISGALISVPLFYLAPLPLMVAALGWGPLSATIGGIAAACGLGVIFGLPYCIAFAVTDAPTAYPSGLVAGFADATGRYLPLACTLNAARVLTAVASMLGVDLDEFAELALAAPPGAGGLVLMPYLDGERTPNLPDATGSVLGITRRNLTPAHLARAATEGMLCGLADAVDALRAAGATAEHLILIGGGA